MNIKYAAAAIAFIFGMALIRYYKERRQKRAAEAPAGSVPGDDGSVLGDDGSVLGDDVPVEMERVFLDEVAAGKRGFRIASVYNQYDIMFIKSLFQSEQIPYYFEFENMSKLRTGIPVFSFNNALLNVLEGDYDDAYAVLKAYKERPDDEVPGDRGASGAERIRNVAELAIGGWKSPSPGDRAIELYDRPDTGIGGPHGNGR